MYREEIEAYVPQNEQEAGDKAMVLEYLRRFPDHILTRDNRIAHFTSSGFVVNGDGTKVLMAHHNLYRVWAWTGGHADGDPDLLAVALREAQEETGVEHLRPLSTAMASLDILPVWGHVKRGGVGALPSAPQRHLSADRRRKGPPPLSGGGEYQGGLAAGGPAAGTDQ